MMSSISKSVCPLCDNADSEYFGTHDYVAQKLFYCKKCSYYFAFPHKSIISESSPNANKRREKKMLRPPESFPEYTIWRQEENSKVIQTIERLDNLGRVLEIGFGEGHLTKNILKKTGDYYGIEPYEEIYNKTLNRLKLDKNKVFCVAAENMLATQDLKKLAGTFDTIIMVSVFEHLPNPIDVLSACSELLKDNGRLFLSTPDSSRFRIFMWGRKLFGLEPWSFYHISFFSQKSLEIGFKKKGFVIQKSFFRPLISNKSSKYFKARSESNFVYYAMILISLLRIDRLLKLGTFNFLLQKGI